MTLAALLRSVAEREPFRGTQVTALPDATAAARVSSIAYDSRTVTAGAVFVALRGAHADGATFARDAVNRGAALVVSEAAPPAGLDGAWMQVRDARLALAALAAAFYRDPSLELILVVVLPLVPVTPTRISSRLGSR